MVLALVFGFLVLTSVIFLAVKASSHRRSSLCEERRARFCFICGQFCPNSPKNADSEAIKIAYKQFYGFELRVKPWTPTSVCNTCYPQLTRWSSGKKSSVKFITPMIWQQAPSHQDCYLCLVEIGKKMEPKYPVNCSSVKLPRERGNLPMPPSPEKYQQEELPIEMDLSESEKDDDDDSDFQGLSSSTLRLFEQGLTLKIFKNSVLMF